MKVKNKCVKVVCFCESESESGSKRAEAPFLCVLLGLSHALQLMRDFQGVLFHLQSGPLSKF